jgi:hypothetical protein
VDGGRMVDRAFMDYVFCKLLDVRVHKGASGGVFDHFLMEGLLKVEWMRKRRNERVAVKNGSPVSPNSTVNSNKIWCACLLCNYML